MTGETSIRQRGRRRGTTLASILLLALLAVACEAAGAAEDAAPSGPVATVEVPVPTESGPGAGTVPPPTAPPPTDPAPTTTAAPPGTGLDARADGAPNTLITAPADGASVTAPVAITGLAATTGRVMRVTVTVKDTGAGRYWNPTTGVWQDAWLWYDANQADEDAPSTSWSLGFDPTGTGASGLYQITAFAWDGGGTRDPIGDRVQFNALGDSSSGDLDLVWADEFDGTTLDRDRWKPFAGEYGTPYRLQHYTARPENVRVADGNLVLEAHHESVGDQDYTSGMVVSDDLREAAVGSNRGNLSWRYGRVEMRARVPDVSGIWPAFWMRPSDSAYGSWPRSGEIDVMEYAGPTPKGTADPGGRFLVANLHTWDAGGGSTGSGSGGSHQNEGRLWVDEGFFDEFHTWAVEWEEGRFRWYVDGQLFHAADRDWLAPEAPFPAPFDQPFFITLNLQVGGWAGPVAHGDLPARFEIDHIRVYQ